MSRLPAPPLDPDGALAWVAVHLRGLFSGEPSHSNRFTGGQSAADRALADFEIAGYAARRNEVFPESRRGASSLSPYIRHGLLGLPHVWRAVAGGPARDVAKFRDELLWQEYARHLYARLGSATARPLRARRLAEARIDPSGSDPWTGHMACINASLDELHSAGWLVNQARMWLASHWSLRHGVNWVEGEDRFYRHLLDGSRAANRLGWQWTSGQATGRPYGFSRTQVERRAPGLCATCCLEATCPITDWPDDPPLEPVEPDPLLRHDPNPDATAGPPEVVERAIPESVWITAESMGDGDPALAAHPGLPAVFVFDDRLLRRLALAAKRLVFMSESLADLAGRRDIEIYVGDPPRVLAGRRPATTFAPVPGWRRIAPGVDTAEVHPWPWLARPHAGSVASFSAWRKRLSPLSANPPGSRSSARLPSGNGRPDDGSAS